MIAIVPKHGATPGMKVWHVKQKQSSWDDAGGSNQLRNNAQTRLHNEGMRPWCVQREHAYTDRAKWNLDNHLGGCPIGDGPCVRRAPDGLTVNGAEREETLSDYVVGVKALGLDSQYP